jgi:hypothetical protein
MRELSSQHPDEQWLYGKPLEEALARRLIWLMAPELGVGPFLLLRLLDLP